MGHVLTLNSDYTPFGILPLSSMDWQSAIRAVFQDAVTVVSEYENWEIRSPSQTIRVPAIVASRTYVNVKRFIGFSKPMLHLRDGFRCQYCGEKFTSQDLTMDHVHPKSMGGTLTFSNVVSACGPCNARRGNDTRIQPRNAPYLPTPGELSRKRRQYPVKIPHASWADYIGWHPDLIQIEEPTGQPGYRPMVGVDDALIREFLDEAHDDVSDMIFNQATA